MNRIFSLIYMLLPPRSRVLKIKSILGFYFLQTGIWLRRFGRNVVHFLRVKNFKTLTFSLPVTSVRYSPFFYSFSYSILIECFTLKITEAL